MPTRRNKGLIWLLFCVCALLQLGDVELASQQSLNTRQPIRFAGIRESLMAHALNPTHLDGSMASQANAFDAADFVRTLGDRAKMDTKLDASGSERTAGRPRRRPRRRRRRPRNRKGRAKKSARRHAKVARRTTRFRRRLRVFRKRQLKRIGRAYRRLVQTRWFDIQQG